MKKLLLAVVSLSFLVGAASFANAKDSPREEIKKSIEEMNTLVEKYNKASDKKKPAIEKQIKEKVAANYEKHIQRMEERTAKLEERVAEMKKEIAQMKTEEAKTKEVEKVTKQILDGKKPMLFNPPWDKDGKMGKPGKHGDMKNWKHHGMKGFHHPEGIKGECKKGTECICNAENCPFHKHGEVPPPPME
ncbi:MAG: hypothetical protein K6E94_06950 [Elusimicrobiaceae bacterium]|nr:hypothetical protein [Elusimicrobiaceae bacterium]